MLTKKQQTSWNKKKGISEMEKTYLNWFVNQSMSCIVCGTHSMVQGHHVKERSTDRKNHFQMIPLCSEHHTGNKISPHGAKKAFFELFPIEAQRKIADRILEAFKENQ